MPPQQPQPQVPPSQPPLTSGPNGNPDPNYGFIFNDQKPKKKLKLSLPTPTNGNLPKFTAMVVGAAVVLGILIVAISSMLEPSGVNTTQLVDVMGHAQEISRVSTIIEQQEQQNADATTINLAATVSSALTSEQDQLTAYLASVHKKISTKDLTLYMNKNTDTQMQTAASNNNLDATYYSYLKQNLTAYKSELSTIFKATPLHAKPILQNAYSSTQTILSAPEVASAT